MVFWRGRGLRSGGRKAAREEGQIFHLPRTRVRSLALRADHQVRNTPRKRRGGKRGRGASGGERGDLHNLQNNE